MHKRDRIDFDRLLGFELLTRELSQALDFKGDSFGAMLGAKVGTEDGPAKAIEFGQLLGFESVADDGRGVVDFQDDTFGNKLGAKIGPIESTEPIDQPGKPRR